MKKCLTSRVLAATLTLVITSQAIADDANAPNVDETEESITVDMNGNSASKTKERDYEVYVSIGSSNFQEDVGSGIGSGESFRLTFGYQFRKWFGFELFEERTPAPETKSIVADLRQSLDERILDYSVATRGNWYGGYFAKFYHRLNETYTLVAKVGVATY